VKILVAEDSTPIRKDVSMSLTDMGHEVLEAADGYEATVALQENDVDILLTDMQMPGLYGDEVIRWVKTNKPSIKTILMSGHPRIKQYAAECGADVYIEKGGLTSWSEKISKALEKIMRA